MIDVNFVRESEIALHGLSKLDEAYTIYYDETNNIRHLHVREDGLNVREPKCFVVGGIAHHGSPRNLGLDNLRAALRIQKTAKEIKLKHVATGQFADLLGAAKLETFFRWLLDSKLFIHYFALDPLYWSVVDVIDTILTEHGERALLMANWELKSDLYAILRQDRSMTVDLFQRYSYPDVGRERKSAFVAEVLDLLECQHDMLPHFNYMMLKGVLEIAKNLSSLPYLEEETPNVLIDGFGLFFIHRICLFKNSEHIFDVEEVVISYISDQEFVDGEHVLANYRFAVSDDEPGIQISDVMTGVLGKLFYVVRQKPGVCKIVEMIKLWDWQHAVRPLPKEGALNRCRSAADATMAFREAVERESVLTIQQAIARMFVSRVGDKFVSELRDVFPTTLRQHRFDLLEDAVIDQITSRSVFASDA